MIYISNSNDRENGGGHYSPSLAPHLPMQRNRPYLNSERARDGRRNIQDYHDYGRRYDAGHRSYDVRSDFRYTDDGAPYSSELDYDRNRRDTGGRMY